MKKLIVGLVGFSLLTLGGLGVTHADDGDSLSFWEKTSLHGTFNTSYTYNFNNPPLGVGSFGRVFNFGSNDFNFNRAELEIENAPTDWIKFRLDLAFGEDVAVVDGLKGIPIGIDEVGIQQGYVALTAPAGNGLTFTVGHFVTLIGAEVIESGYNFNTSRSFLFGFAIPFTHTGVLMTYPVNDWFEFTVGVVNGWDTITDLNKAKTAIYQLAFAPSEQISFSVQGTAGPDADACGAGCPIAAPANDGDWTFLVDFVLTWQPIEEFVLNLNLDWANQKNTGSKTDWWGGSLILAYDFNDIFGIAVRGEYFDDHDAFRFATGPGLDMYEGTLTLRFYPGEGTQVRIEYRHDQADQAVFTKSDGTLRKFQDTISGELVYNF